MFDYWYSDAAESWLVADKDGELIAIFPTIELLKQHMQMSLLVYNYAQCDKGCG